MFYLVKILQSDGFATFLLFKLAWYLRHLPLRELSLTEMLEPLNYKGSSNICTSCLVFFRLIYLLGFV